MRDFVIGTIKAPIFGLVIAMQGCFQGMQVKGNAEDVGARTTRAVPSGDASSTTNIPIRASTANTRSSNIAIDSASS